MLLGSGGKLARKTDHTYCNPPPLTSSMISASTLAFSSCESGSMYARASIRCSSFRHPVASPCGTTSRAKGCTIAKLKANRAVRRILEVNSRELSTTLQAYCLFFVVHEVLPLQRESVRTVASEDYVIALLFHCNHRWCNTRDRRKN